MPIKNQLKIKELIKKYELYKHPEGGLYRRKYVSDEKIMLPNAKRPLRSTESKIDYLILKKRYSAWHRLKNNEETWIYKAGATIKLHLLTADFLNYRCILLNKKKTHFTIEKNTWLAAETTGDYSFLECSVKPEFDFEDFELMSQKIYLALKKVFIIQNHKKNTLNIIKKLILKKNKKNFKKYAKREGIGN